jgi:drug/metabolite transporter (DMT)-like permease
MFIRFALAWAALYGWAFLTERESVKWMGRCELIGLNVERFSRPLNCVNLFFLGLCASALAFAFWSKACAQLGVVKTTICLYLGSGVCSSKGFAP